jgi:hypothetical protein
MSPLTLREEVIPLVKSSLGLKRRALEFNLRKYQERLAQFEQRYGMSSQEFANEFDAGELGDEAHWFEWQYVLGVQQGTQRQLALLESVERECVSHRSPGE